MRERREDTEPREEEGSEERRVDEVEEDASRKGREERGIIARRGL